jgi:hypothetical protein
MAIMIYWSFQEGMDACVHELDGSSMELSTAESPWSFQ